MNLGLKNKIALITASSKGLGRASAEVLASEQAGYINGVSIPVDGGRLKSAF